MRLQSPGGVPGVGDSISRRARRPQFITTWTFSAGCWSSLALWPPAVPEQVMPTSRMRAQVSCMSWPWKLHIIYIISFWLHRSFLWSMRGDHWKACVPGGRDHWGSSSLLAVPRGMQDLGSLMGIEPMLPAVETRNLNHPKEFLIGRPSWRLATIVTSIHIQ